MRRGLRLSALGLLLAGLASCSLFDYSGIVTHRYALVYGVSRYTAAELPSAPGNPTVYHPPNLAYPGIDASAMAALLQPEGYTVSYRLVDANGIVWTTGGVNNGSIGAPSTIDGSTNSGTPGLGDPQAPTKANILADIQGLSGIVGPNDVLLIYFSGHGTQDTSSSPAREYFDPFEAVMQYGTGYYAFPDPSVRDDELRLAFDAINTPRKVLILDTCNSGGFIGNLLESDWTPQAVAGSAVFVGLGTLAAAIANYANMTASTTGLSPYGAQVLSAAGRNEASYEADTYMHGVMTYWLLQGLAGPADLNNDGQITVLEAFAYAKAGVDQDWNPAVGSTKAFEPHVSGGPVDFVLF